MAKRTVAPNFDLVDLIPAQMPATFFTPTPTEEKRWREAMAYLVFKWPLFAQLIYSGMPIRYTEEVPWAATDSHSIFINPEGCERDGMNDVFQRAFILAHEVSHRIFNDLVMM